MMLLNFLTIFYYYYPPIYTINIGTRKRLHDIPRFLILFLGQEILMNRIVFLAQPVVEHPTVLLACTCIMKP